MAMKGILGRKLGMTRVFGDDGAHVPVTVIAAGPCPVVQVTETRVQLGFDTRKAKRTPYSSELGSPWRGACRRRRPARPPNTPGESAIRSP